MDWILSSLRTRHVPKEIIIDDIYLWARNDYEYRLAVEWDRLRIYCYEYWSEDTIRDNHEGEDWWAWLDTVFYWAYDAFDINTMQYNELHFEWKSAEDIARFIVEWVDNKMTDDVNDYLVVNNDWENKVPSQRLINLIQKALDKTWERVYCYYK